MHPAAKTPVARAVVLIVLVLLAPAASAGLDIVSIDGPTEPIGIGDGHQTVTLEVVAGCNSVLLRQAPGFGDTVPMRVDVDVDEHLLAAWAETQSLDATPCNNGAQQTNGTVQVLLTGSEDAPALTPLEARIRVALHDHVADTATDEAPWTIQAKAVANLGVQVHESTLPLQDRRGTTTITLTNQGNTPLRVDVVPATSRNGVTVETAAEPQTLAPGAQEDMTVQLTAPRLKGPTALQFTVQATSTQDPEAVSAVDVELLAMPPADDVPASSNREAVGRLAMAGVVFAVAAGLAGLVVYLVRRRS